MALLAEINDGRSYADVGSGANIRPVPGMLPQQQRLALPLDGGLHDLRHGGSMPKRLRETFDRTRITKTPPAIVHSRFTEPTTSRPKQVTEKQIIAGHTLFVVSQEPPAPQFTTREGSRLLVPEGSPRLFAAEAREKIRAFVDKKEEPLSLESADIQDMLNGVGKFKKYNVHEQINDDFDGNGAYGLGEGKFRVPNHDRYPFLFPHDLYFMAKADQGTQEGRELTESALDKISTFYEKHRIIPNYTAQSALIASARPLFLPTVWEWYQAHPEKDTPEIKEKLLHYVEVGASEHDNVWNNKTDKTGQIGTKHHVVAGYGWLRSYGDRDAGDNYQASRESGWDRSHTRFGGQERDYLAQDLQPMLAKGKQIVADAMGVLAVEEIAGRTRTDWAYDAAENRLDIQNHHFDAATGNSLDVNYRTGERSNIETIASAWMLWGDVATGEQALSIMGNLMRLDSGHGLMVTHPDDLPKIVSDEALITAGVHATVRPAVHALQKEANWDAKIWPNELMIVTEGSLNYIRKRGGHDHGLSSADRLALTRFNIKLVQDEIRTQAAIFKENNGKFAEKWRPDGKDDNGHYTYEPQANGLGWSAALAELNVKRYLPELRYWEGVFEAELAANVPEPRAGSVQVYPSMA